MSERIGYIPLSEANSEQVRTDLSLPFRLQNEIGLHLGKVHRLMQIGGISHLKINESESKKTSRVSVGVAGFNNGNTALSSIARTESVDLSQNGYTLNDSRYHSSRWSELQIVVNVDELQQRILHSGRSVDDPENWSRPLNRVVRKEIVKAGVKTLMSEPSDRDRVYGYMVFGIALFTCAMEVLIKSQDNPLIFAANFLHYGVRNSLIANMIRKIYSDSITQDQLRLSLFMGREFDRALLLFISAAGKPLVVDLVSLEEKETK